MKRCVIISGGEFSMAVSPKQGDFIIACDRGYDYAKRMELKPDVILGDFDSYAGELPEDIPVLHLPCEKDDTDTQFAIKYAIEKGADEIILTCALGGRFDHGFANIQSCVYALHRGAGISIIEAKTKILFIHNGGSMVLPAEKGRSLSLFSLSERCDGVTESGVKYPLENAVLEYSFPLGVSNEWSAPEARISAASGTLMIIIAEK